MNYILGRGLAGKSWDQQLSVNAIYEGVVSVNENKSDKEIVVGQAANVISVASGEAVDTLFNLSGKNGLFKQVASSVFSGYVENKIEENSKNKKEEE